MVSGGGSPLYPEFLQYYTMILQRPRIIVGDAGFEPGTSASEVWRATKVATASPILEFSGLIDFPYSKSS